MKQHLGRQSGVLKVDVNLLDGKVDITPKEDGHVDPREILKATYDSGVSVAEMDLSARGTIATDASGHLGLQVRPELFLVFAPSESSRDLEPLAGSVVTVRGQLYKKAPGRKKAAPGMQLQLLILDIERRE